MVRVVETSAQLDRRGPIPETPESKAGRRTGHSRDQAIASAPAGMVHHVRSTPVDAASGEGMGVGLRPVPHAHDRRAHWATKSAILPLHRVG
jgi:hypothetical protein